MKHESAETIFMLYKFARLLQLAGLILLPVAIAGNVAEKLNLWESLRWSALGMLIFFIGWSLQKGVKPQ
jgi:hypothetical protein